VTDEAVGVTAPQLVWSIERRRRSSRPEADAVSVLTPEVFPVGLGMMA